MELDRVSRNPSAAPSRTRDKLWHNQAGLSSAVMKSVARQLSALGAVTRPEDADDGSLGYSGTEDSDYVQPGGVGGAAMDSDAESDDEGSH